MLAIRELLKAPRSSSYSAASKEGQGKTLPPRLRREDAKKMLPPSLRMPRGGAEEDSRNPSDPTQPQSFAAISPKARRRKPLLGAFEQPWREGVIKNPELNRK